MVIWSPNSLTQTIANHPLHSFYPNVLLSELDISGSIKHMLRAKHPVAVQLLGAVQLFVTPWTATRQTSRSFTISKSLLKLVSIESVMPSNHLILCCPLSSCLQSFSASGSFQWGSSSHQLAKALATNSVLDTRLDLGKLLSLSDTQFLQLYKMELKYAKYCMDYMR